MAPLPLMAVAIMAINDHFLRVRWPGPVTGKISDFAVLFFAPLFLSALFDYLLYTARAILSSILPRLSGRINFNLTRGKALVSVVTTGIFFILLKTSLPFRDAYISFLSNFTFTGRNFKVAGDPTDLVALPMLLLSFIYALQKVKRLEGWQCREIS